jgi:hypothetical protein
MPSFPLLSPGRRGISLRDVVSAIDSYVPIYRVETTQELFVERSKKLANLLTGIAIGTTFSCVGLRGLSALGGPPFYPLLFGAVPLVLLVTTLLAAAIPARRAASIDPQRALRQD